MVIILLRGMDTPIETNITTNWFIDIEVKQFPEGDFTSPVEVSYKVKAVDFDGSLSPFFNEVETQGYVYTDPCGGDGGKDPLK